MAYGCCCEAEQMVGRRPTELFTSLSILQPSVQQSLRQPLGYLLDDEPTCIDGRTDERTDRRTERRTDGRTDRQTDRRTDPLIEMRGRI